MIAANEGYVFQAEKFGIIEGRRQEEEGKKQKAIPKTTWFFQPGGIYVGIVFLGFP